MAKTNSHEYIETLNKYEREGEEYVCNLNIENQLNYSYYFRELFGDEVVGESQAVSSDCFDVVEADMPSLVRTFLSGGDVMEFAPVNADDDAQVMEAKQKTKYINKLILGDSFTMFYEWFKGAEISDFSVVTYYPDEQFKPEIIRRTGLSQIEVDALLDSLEEEDDVESVEIEKEEYSETDGFEIEYKVTRRTMDFKSEWIPEDDFIMAPARCIEDSPMVGHRSQVSKGDLVGKFPKLKKDIKELAASQSLLSDSVSSVKDRQTYESGDSNIAPEWYAEMVTVSTMSVRIDKDGDGYAERRRILKAGDLILEDEPFDNVNYALISAYPTPGKPVGKSRVGVTRESQRQKSYMQRGIYNNIASVNKPMVGVNTDAKLGATANTDDLLSRRTNGVVRTKGDPSSAMFPLVTPYIGSQALEVIQYVDFQRAQSTGALMASQSLSKDNIYDETATRFQGVSDEGAAKMELVMRIYAETGIKKLFEGFAWMVSNYQSSEIEEKIMGEQVVFNPSEWRYTASCKPRVGLAAADTETLKANLGAILNILQTLQAAGSTIADESKVYNTLKKLLNSMGVYDVSEFINNPTMPAEVAQAQLEQSKQLISQLQQQVQTNPLAEAETIKAQARLVEASAKDQTDRDKARATMMERQQDFALRKRKLEQDEREFMMEYSLDVTKLELDNKVNLEGGIDEQ